MKTTLSVAALALLGVSLVGCEAYTPSSDETQQAQQERILQEGTAQTGMPNIKNFRERKLLKQIIEMRDQDGLVTYTYTVPEMTGRPVFLCNSIGYGLPAATQYTNPQKTEARGTDGIASVPQADPNGLFSPDSAEGTWVLCSDPSGSGKTRPVYVEPRVIVSPFKL
jgi:hypothetical protein